MILQGKITETVYGGLVGVSPSTTYGSARALGRGVRPNSPAARMSIYGWEEMVERKRAALMAEHAQLSWIVVEP